MSVAPNYDPKHVKVLTDFLNALTRSSMTQNDTFRLLEEVRDKFGLPSSLGAFLAALELLRLSKGQAPTLTPEEAATAYHTGSTQ